MPSGEAGRGLHDGRQAARAAVRDGAQAAGRAAELGGDGGLVGGVDARAGRVGRAVWQASSGARRQFSVTAAQRAGSTPAGPSATSRHSWRYQGSPSVAGSAARSAPVDGSWTM